MMYILMHVPQKTKCSGCWIELERGLMGVKMFDTTNSRFAYCDVCLSKQSQGLALTLASARLMRQAAAHSLADLASDEALGLQLISFAKAVEKDLSNCWRRRDAVAVEDCEHCFLKFCSSESQQQLSSDQETILLHAFDCALRSRYRDGAKASDMLTRVSRELRHVSPENKQFALDKLEAFFFNQLSKGQLCPLAPKQLSNPITRSPMAASPQLVEEELFLFKDR